MSFHPCPAFTYVPLSSQNAEFRLLRLLRCSDPHSPVHCSLTHISLQHDIAYEALSYTWGDESDPALIYIDGATLSVTRNLHAALCALRNTDSNRDLWVDAVCINQKDTAERGREVLRMLEIYGRATRVVIWLGEESESSALAIEHLRTLAQDSRVRSYVLELSNRAAYIKKFAKEVFLIMAYVANATKVKPFAAAWVLLAYTVFPRSSGIMALILQLITLWQLLKLVVTAAWAYFKSDWLLLNADSNTVDRLYIPHNASVSALKEFFSRPWFYRVWVVQEAVASQNVLVICGQLQLPWSDLCDACDHIDYLVSRTPQRNAYVETLYRSTHAMRSLTSKKSLANKARNSEFGLLNLLWLFRHFAAKDPRDKVYALLGLARGVQEQTALVDSFQPDYAKSVEVVYADTVRFLVTQMGNLDVLRFCDGLCRRPNLSTWAPDWTVAISRSTKPVISQSKSYELAIDPNPEIPVARFSDDLRAMTTRGFIVGHLADDGDCIYSSKDPRGLDQFKDRGIDLNFLIKWCTHYTSWLTETGILNFLFRSFAKMFTFFYPEAKPHIEPYVQMFEDLTQDYLREPPPDNDAELIESAENIFVPASARNDEEPEMVKWIFTWQHSMPEGLTVNPFKCHTMAPKPQKGDLTCLFVGASVGILLRPIDNHYQIIGDADFGPFVKCLWHDCEKQHQSGRLLLLDFELR